MTGFLNDPNQSNNNPRQFMLAMALMLGVLFTWQTLYPPVPPGAAPDGEGSGEAAIGEAPPAPAFRAEGSAEGSAEGTPEAMAPAAPEAEAIPALPAADAERRERRAGLHQHGRAPRRGHRRRAGAVHPERRRRRHLPGAARTLPPPRPPHRRPRRPHRRRDLPLRRGGERGLEDEGYDSLVYRWRSPDGAIDVVKRFRATETPFGARMDVEVHNVSASARRFENLDVRVYGSFSPDEGGGLMGQMGSVVETLCYGEYGTERKPARKVKRASPASMKG